MGIEFFLKKGSLWADVVKVRDGKREIIGSFMQLNSSEVYTHFSPDHVPTCVRGNGETFKVPLGESIPLSGEDQLHFPLSNPQPVCLGGTVGCEYLYKLPQLYNDN